MSPIVVKTLQQTRRYLRIAGGFALLVLGVVLVVSPGPGWLVILLGLGLLAVDFVWARRLLNRLKLEGSRVRNFVLSRNRAV